MPAVKVYGDDFFAVHEAAWEAVERARAGGGPSAIEVDTCRFYGHHSGDAQLYRGKDEVKRLRDERDCLKHFRARVTEAALLEASALDAVDGEVAALIDRAVATARAAPLPPESALLTDVYVSVLIDNYRRNGALHNAEGIRYGRTYGNQPWPRI